MNLIYLRNYSYLSPVLFLLAILGFEGLMNLDFLLEPRISYKKVEPAIYHSREDLFLQMKDEISGDVDSKGGVIFGSSRSAAFSMRQWRNETNLKMYNFSVPLGTPSYYYYWLEKMLESGIPIDLVVIELDPIQFTEYASKFPLRYGYTLSFFLSNIDFFRETPVNPWLHERAGFSRKEIDAYLITKIFNTSSYPFRPSVLREAFKQIRFPDGDRTIETDANAFKLWFREVLEKEINRNLYGSIPALPFHVPADKGLDADSELMIKRYNLKYYKASQTQLAYLNKLLLLASNNRIKVLIYEPPVYNRLHQELSEIQINNRSFRSGLKELLTQKFPEAVYTQPLDIPGFGCREFKDSLHLAERCYKSLSRALFESISSRW